LIEKIKEERDKKLKENPNLNKEDPEWRNYTSILAERDKLGEAPKLDKTDPYNGKGLRELRDESPKKVTRTELYLLSGGSIVQGNIHKNVRGRYKQEMTLRKIVEDYWRNYYKDRRPPLTDKEFSKFVNDDKRIKDFMYSMEAMLTRVVESKKGGLEEIVCLEVGLEGNRFASTCGQVGAHLSQAIINASSRVTTLKKEAANKKEYKINPNQLYAIMTREHPDLLDAYADYPDTKEDLDGVNTFFANIKAAAKKGTSTVKPAGGATQAGDIGGDGRKG
jgi:hypothetical protein